MLCLIRSEGVITFPRHDHPRGHHRDYVSLFLAVFVHNAPIAEAAQVFADFSDFVLEADDAETADAEPTEISALPLPSPDVSPTLPARIAGLERLDSFDFNEMLAAVENDSLLDIDPTPALAMHSAAGCDFSPFTDMQSVVPAPDVAPLEDCVPGSNAKRAAPLGSVGSQLARMTRAEAAVATAPGQRARQPANIQHLQQRARAGAAPPPPAAAPVAAFPGPMGGAQPPQGAAAHSVDITPQPAPAVRARLSP